ncbi:unnamed protein product [Schistocephalus solidus]|uniref:Uncharacterized protein n=1 Tax=Schistocephalus solidus TaxID=70667 RepID=A0A183SEN3_SCHSO|nr:unnamed protein product [Schistocephalus solidus]
MLLGPTLAGTQPRNRNDRWCKLGEGLRCCVSPHPLTPLSLPTSPPPPPPPPLSPFSSSLSPLFYSYFSSSTSRSLLTLSSSPTVE